MLYSLSRFSLYQHIHKDLPLKAPLNVDRNLSGAGVKKVEQDFVIFLSRIMHIMNTLPYRQYKEFSNLRGSQWGVSLTVDG